MTTARYRRGVDLRDAGIIGLVAAVGLGLMLGFYWLVRIGFLMIWWTLKLGYWIFVAPFRPRRRHHVQPQAHYRPPVYHIHNY